MFSKISFTHHQQLPKVTIIIPAANLLANFSILITYENFITLGLVAAVPASAGDWPHHPDIAFCLWSRTTSEYFLLAWLLIQRNILINSILIICIVLFQDTTLLFIRQTFAQIRWSWQVFTENIIFIVAQHSNNMQYICSCVHHLYSYPK